MSDQDKMTDLGKVLTGKSFEVELRELQYDLATDLQTGEAGLDEVEQIIAAITQLHQAYSNQRYIQGAEDELACVRAGGHDDVGPLPNTTTSGSSKYCLATLKQGGGEQ